MGSCGAGGNGISMHGVVDAGGNYNTITCNYLHDNAKCGLHMKFKCMHNTISNNKVTGNAGAGIMPECKKSDWNTFEYNYIADNGPYYGFYTRGNNNVIRYNTIINTKGVNGHYYGIYIGTAGMPSPYGRYNNLANNSVCGSQAEDIIIEGTAPAADNTVNDNTCDLSIGGSGNGCPWNCDDLASVYYDFDGDGLYSPTSCPCSNDGLCVGSCCNPGLFNSSGVSQHCAGGVCQTSPGDDDCDCGDLPEPHYVLNWDTYPYSTWEDPNWSGPAAMEMMINHYRPPGFMPSQTWLNATGIAHNQQDCNENLSYVDPKGMKETLNVVLHNTTNGGRYANYGIGSYTTVEKALWYICYWQYAGPGAAPTYGNYSNWMAIRGIHTSENPKWKSQGSYDIYGFWINDPKDPGGIGENTYKCVDQWIDQYHKSLTDVRAGDAYLNKYVAVCEPPEPGDVEVRAVHSPARLDGAVKAELMGLDVVKAAIDGVTEELVPYDAEFAEVFAKTVAGRPLLVTDEGGDYYLVPFNVPIEKRPIPIRKPVEIENVDGSRVKLISAVDGKAVIKPVPVGRIRIKEERTLVVVIVDAEDGSFKEASWVADPVKYLSVSKREALRLVFKEMRQNRFRPRPFGRPVIELVHRAASSPYSPDWKITIGQMVFYVSQDGTVSYDKPLPTPTRPPRPIKPRPIRVMPI